MSDALCASLSPGAGPPPIPKKKGSSTDLAGDPDTRTVRPTTETDVFNWFRTSERVRAFEWVCFYLNSSRFLLQPKGIGLDAAGRMQIWFHGMISREDSEVNWHRIQIYHTAYFA